MKKLLQWLMMLLLALLLCTPAHGRDMRTLQVQAREDREALMKKAAEEKRAAQEAAAESRARIMSDRAALEKAVEEKKDENRRLEREIERLTVESREVEEKENALSRKIAETDSVIRELVGVIRVNAKDICSLIEQDLQSAIEKEDIHFLQAIAGQSQFPGMADIRKMASVLGERIRMSGEVRLARGTIVDRTGKEAEADLLVLGGFTAAYRTDNEVGFLNYSPAGRKLFALSRLPARRLQKELRLYMEGQGGTVPIDVSRGGALRQLTHKLSLWQQIPKGGPIVWPILAILTLGIAIIAERTIFLLRKRFDADSLTDRIAALAEDRNWQDCRDVCGRHADKPVARVVAAGLEYLHMQREAMENALQEAILKEVPPMERFLSTLGMLAAIAPLLGLLGTVTGMIDTFHVITQHGTGDPRMMSGGISEALVTTMLGLSVAIPIMLAHTLLNRAVDKQIGQMEEKAVALVNIVHRNRNAGS